MVIAVPVAVLILLVAVVVFSVLNSGGSDAGQAGDLKPVKAPVTSGASETTSAVESPPAATESTASQATTETVNENYEVYETRDPFIKPEFLTAPTASGPSATTVSATSTPVSGQTEVLALKSITSQGGVLYANVDYGADSYVVRAGERVGTSSYQVISISSDSATFLYGDDTLTLNVGDDVQK